MNVMPLPGRWPVWTSRVLLAVAGVHVLTLLLPVRGALGSLTASDQVLLCSVGALVVVLCAARVGAPAGGAPWAWFGAYAALSTVASLEVVASTTAAVGLSLLRYAVLHVALLLLLRRSVTRYPASACLDGLVAGLGAGALLVAVALGQVVTWSGAGPTASLVALAHPAADLLLLGVVAVAVSGLRWRPGPVWWGFAAAQVVLLVADVGRLLVLTRGSAVPAAALDALWVAALVLPVLVPLRPGPVQDEQDGRVSGALAVPGAAALVCLGLLSVQAVRPLPALAVVLAVLGLLAAAVRVGLTSTEVRGLLEARRQALTDDLTGLPNRRRFAEQLEETLVAGTQVGVLLLDLDRFKEVNDSLGHHLGDELLRLAGPRLAEQLRPTDTLARLGGDEFGLLLQVADDEKALRVGERVRAALQEPFEVGGVSLHIDASVGIALSGRHGSAADALLHAADTAMYEAKRSGKGVVVYDQERDGQARSRRELAEALREAVHGDQLVLHYQPKLDVAQDRVTGVEALVRWQHPTRGLLYPDAFLELAEQTGLIKPLAVEVLDQALAQCARWRRDGLDLTVAVNVSPSNLLDLSLPRQVIALLHRHGLPSSSLTLEVTEAVLVQERETAMTVLTELRTAGVQISIDDYGTGYSSLAYLAELPVDELKLDRSFVSRITTDAGVAAIVRSTVDLGHALGLTLVAEGVEDAGSLALLATMGCDVVQGYHLCRPVAAEDLVAWLGVRTGAALVPATRTTVPEQRPSEDDGRPGGATAPATPVQGRPATTGGPAAVPAAAPPLLALPDLGGAFRTLGRGAGPGTSLGFAAVGLAVVLGSRWLADGPQLVLLSLVQVVGALAVLVGVRRHRPVRPGAWLALAAGGTAFGAGVACWYVYAQVLQEPIPYPGWPDLFFVPAFLSYLTGLALMIGRRAPARQTQALLDALVLAVGLAFANWVYLTGPALHGSAGVGQTVISVVYPMIDVVMVGVVARLLLTGGGIPPALLLVAGGMVCNLVGDTAYAVLASLGLYQTGALPDQMWMLSMVLVGAAALHPSMRSAVTQVEDRRVGSSRLRLLFLFVSLHVPVVVLAASLGTGTEVPVTAAALTFAVTGPLTALRIWHLTGQLRTLSMSDKLTGLASRELLVEHLERRRSAHRCGTSASGMLFIDLDRFKAVNDTFGHAAGDDVLVLASKRLQRLAGPRDLVCRLGGDEFVLVVDGVRSVDDAAGLAQRVVDSLSEPFHVWGHEVSIGASVGITVLDGEDPAAVLRRGDAAMYRAKAGGRSRWA